MQNIFIIIYILAIWANTYEFVGAGLGYGELLLLLIFPLLLTRKSNNSGYISPNTANLYVFYCFYCFFITLINCAILGEFGEGLKSLVRNLFYVALYTIISKKWFDYSKAKKMFSLFCIALSCFIAVQFVAYYLGGIYISGFIPGLSIDDGFRIERALTAASYAGYLRPSGFLSEPAVCAQLLILALLIEVIPYYKEKMNVVNIVIYLIGLILSTSTNAYIFLAVAFALWLYNGKNVHIKHKKVIYCGIAICSIWVVVHYYEHISVLTDSISKIESVNEGTNNSAGLRLMRGPAFFNKMPILGQLFGHGWGNFILYRDQNHIWTVFEEDEEYMSAFFSYLTGVGLIGTILVMTCFLKAIRKTPFKNKAIAIMLIVMAMSSSIGHSLTGAIFLSFALWSRPDSLKTT